MINLNYLMYPILYWILKIIFSIFFKKYTEMTDSLSVRIHVNKIENRIAFEIKTGHYLELLTTETMISEIIWKH